jgi:predicted RNase H-like nuclease (RuvC/YqgF family)
MLAAVRKSEESYMDTPERIAKLEAQVESLKEDVAELKDDVREIHSRITTGNREIIEKIDSMDRRVRDATESATIQHQKMQSDLKNEMKSIEDKVNILERWRYMIVGGAIALGYLVSHLDIFGKIFSAR